MEKTLIIFRGLPGSGKSSLARLLAGKEWPVFSIDDYFTDPQTGKYDFRFAENHLAYSSCQERADQAMKSGIGRIFIDNTFTFEWEIQPYFELASRYGYRVHCVTVENRHNGVNVHGISREQVLKMAEKYRVVLY